MIQLSILIPAELQALLERYEELLAVYRSGDSLQIARTNPEWRDLTQRLSAASLTIVSHAYSLQCSQPQP